MYIFGCYLYGLQRLLMLLQTQPSKPGNQSVNGVIKRRPNGRTLMLKIMLSISLTSYLENRCPKHYRKIKSLCSELKLDTFLYTDVTYGDE